MAICRLALCVVVGLFLTGISRAQSSPDLTEPTAQPPAEEPTTTPAEPAAGEPTTTQQPTTSAAEPTTTQTASAAPDTTPTTPTTATDPAVTTATSVPSQNVSTTVSSPSGPAPSHGFDLGSFFGGFFLCAAIIGIIYFGCKMFRSKKPDYSTL